MKKDAENFKGNYLIRQSPFVLVWRVLTLEIIAGVFLYTGIFIIKGVLSSDYIFVFIIGIKIIFLIAVILKWYSHFYIISGDSISMNSGVLRRRMKTIDVYSIRSIKLKQNIFGKIFHYGTLSLESPLLRKDVFLRSIGDPNRHAQTLEAIRIEHLNKKSTNITPVV